MRRRLFTAATAVLFLAGSVWAADHFIGGDRIRLKDPSGNAAGRRARFVAAKDAAIMPTLMNDPRMLGGELEIMGANPGDGSTGVIMLDPMYWVGLGNPVGSMGFKYLDTGDSVGVRKVVFINTANGGKLVVVGRGTNWPYQVTQTQGSIRVRFSVGTENYCAQFLSYRRNEVGLVVGTAALPPASCTPVCGNGVVDAGEECDDNNLMNGDGCSSTCTLENTSAVCDGMPTTAGTAIKAVLVAGGLSLPNTVTAPPLDTSRVFVIEKAGNIRLVKDGVLQGTPFLDINSRVHSTCENCEQGLLGLAFHPDYENNGYFFVNYTDNFNVGDTRISRFTAIGDPKLADTADPASEQILITITQPYSNHNGGNIVFGPDGYLWVGMGDGGSAEDPQERGQDDSELLGKMLRLDVNNPVAPFYSVPANNPHAGDGDPLGLIWAKGLRNPWRFSFDRGNGDLYIGDVGQYAVEEVDWVPASSTGAENYGWDIFEGSTCFADTQPLSGPCPPPAGFTFPVEEYTHSNGCSVTGGFVYRGCALPDLHGTYFYSDYCSSFINTFEISGGAATNQQDRTGDINNGVSVGSVVSFGEDARGEMYITDQHDGEVFKIVPE